MPANSTIIGRVAVKVLPDVTDFRRDAERKLSGIEKSLKLAIPTRIDMSGLKRDFLEQVQVFNERNKASDSRKIRFYTRISTEGMREAVVKARRELQALADGNKIDFKVDTLDAGVIKAKVDLDSDSLRNVEHEIDRWKKKVEPITLKVNLELANGATIKVNAALDVITRKRSVKIAPEIDGTAAAKVATFLAALSGARVISNAFDDIGQAIRNLDKSVATVGALTLAVTNLSAGALAGVSNIFALGSSFAAIGPAALALPGIFGGIAIGLAASVSSLRDFNKYLPEFAVGLGRKVTAGAAFKELQDIMSLNFWEGFKGPIEEMIKIIFPKFQAGLLKVSTQLGQFYGGLAKGVTGTLSTALDGMFTDLSKSIDIATGATGALVGIITTLGTVGTGYLPRLATQFVKVTTEFDKFLSQAAKDGRLQQWIDTAITNLRDLGSVLSSIGSIFASIGRAATAAGGSSLAILADTLKQIATIAKSKGFQTGLVGVFEAAHAAIGSIITTSGPGLLTFFRSLSSLLTAGLPVAGAALGVALNAIASALGRVSVSTGILALLDGIRRGIDSLVPAMAPLADALGALAGFLGTLAAGLGTALSAALQVVAPAFTTLLRAVEPLVPVLTSGLANAFQLLGPTVQIVADALAGLLTNGALPAITSAVLGLLPLVQQLAPVLGTVLVAAIAALTPLLQPVADNVGSIATAFTMLATTALPILTPLLESASRAFKTVLEAVGPFYEAATKLVVVAFEPLVKVLAKLTGESLPGLGTVLADIIKAVTKVIDKVSEHGTLIQFVLIPIYTAFAVKAGITALAVVASWASMAFAAVTTAYVYAAQFVIMGVGYLRIAAAAAVSALSVVGSWLATAAGAVVATLAHAAQVALQIGQWVLLKIAAGLNAALIAAAWLLTFIGGAVVATVGMVVQVAIQIGRWAALAAAAALNAARVVIAWVITQVGAIVAAGIMAVQTGIMIARWIAHAAVASASAIAIGIAWLVALGPIGLLVAAVIAATVLIIRYWGEIKAAFIAGGKVILSALSALNDGINAVFAGAGRLLLGAGRAIIQGLIDGIQSGFQTVKNLLGSLTDLLPSWKGPPARDSTLLTNAGSLIITSLIDGMESQYEAVRKSLGGLTKEIGSTLIDAPALKQMSNSKSALGHTITASVDAARVGSEGAGVTKNLYYYAAPGPSLDSEESLFAAADRGRMVGW